MYWPYSTLTLTLTPTVTLTPLAVVSYPLSVLGSDNEDALPRLPKPRPPSPPAHLLVVALGHETIPNVWRANNYPGGGTHLCMTRLWMDGNVSNPRERDIKLVTGSSIPARTVLKLLQDLARFSARF